MITLKDLEIGDIFINVKDKKTKWIVRGSSCFNSRHGSPTRVCLKCSDGTLVSKSCRIEVKKIGESKYKDKMKLTPMNFR
jgi:hypothetical protein